MLFAQNCVDEKDLRPERRNALVVLRVQNRIKAKPQGIIYLDLLWKPSNQGKMKLVKNALIETNLNKRYVILTRFEFKWYKTKKDFDEDKFHGRVKLPFIYEIKKITVLNGKPSFDLGLSMYDKNHKTKAGKRNVIFTCKNFQERDKWVATIDFLKTKAIYDAYAKNN